MEEQAQNKQIGAIAVHSQYIKDLSLEIPPCAGNFLGDQIRAEN